MPTTEPLAAWILAGGLSSRFGSDKALFEVGGETLLARTVRVCRAAGLRATVVARAERPGGLPTLIEPAGPRHPLHGVATALREAHAKGHAHALCLPCDLPTIEADILRRLVAVPPPAYAAECRLLCVLPVTAAPLADALAARDGSVREFLVALGATPVDTGPVENLNSPR